MNIKEKLIGNIAAIENVFKSKTEVLDTDQVAAILGYCGCRKYQK